MEGRRFLHRKDREALRERWLLRAGQAFERMFAEAHQEQLVTFSQREDMACLLSQELAAFLLEEHLAVEGAIRAPQSRPPACPHCQQPGQRATPADEDLPERELRTDAGDVKLRREKWFCAKCRRVFFSVRPQAAIGDRGVQSAGAQESHAPGGQGRVVSGRQ